MIHKLDIHKETAARRVLDMQLRSYAVEAEIIGFNEIPPLHDTIHSLSNSGETFLGCFESESLVAVISYKFQDSILDIHRLFVDPEYFRQGYAGRMLQAVESAEVGIGKTSSLLARRIFQRSSFMFRGDSCGLMKSRLRRGFW
ncbi:MAG: GNAT family N-acetyltransferase [Actinomycetota bacterium]|nr:GNAT family N-acetyltransferase [Actinomycetota bacterium]